MKVTSTDVKNSFGKYLRLCANEPVYITKNGEIIAKLTQQQTEADEDHFAPSVSEEIVAKYNYNRVKMSYEEFLHMNENTHNRYEYIDGEIYLLSAPNVFHQRVISRLHVQMDRYLEGKPCDVFMSPFDVFLKIRTGEYRDNIVQPDLLVICNWRDETDEKGKYKGVPRLVVEVLSPSNSTKEQFKKLNLYRESGVEEYWLIDPESCSCLIYRFDNFSITETRFYSRDEICESMIYPGLSFCVLEE